MADIYRAMHLRHLEEADRHVAQGERQIAEQEQRIIRLGGLGHDTTEAGKLLDNFHGTQLQHIRDRDRIRNEWRSSAPGPLSDTSPGRHANHQPPGTRWLKVFLCSSLGVDLLLKARWREIIERAAETPRQHPAPDTFFRGEPNGSTPRRK